MKLKQLSLGGICTAQVYDFKRLEYTDEGSINLIFHNDPTRTDQEAILTCYRERPVYIDEYYTPKSNVLLRSSIKRLINLSFSLIIFQLQY